jgi:hypothetical protein
MKPTEYPHLREKIYKGKNGNTYTYYVWDGRSLGIKDVRLGSDRQRAIELWALCEKGAFPEQKKKVKKIGRIAPLRKGTRRRIENDVWLNQPQWARTMFYNAERRAKATGKSFRLSPDAFIECIDRASGKCEVSGIPFVLDEKRSPFAPSIDRIDSSIGYDPGNVRLVCHVANVAMNTWGMDPLVKLVDSFLRQRTAKLGA